MSFRARAATPEDAEEIARVYNQGIEDGTATFETRPRTAPDVRAWFDGVHPIVVVVPDPAPVPVDPALSPVRADPPPPLALSGVEAPGRPVPVVAFASTSAHSHRECYRGVAEFSVYVARERRGQGAGRIAMEALVEAAERAGFWKLVGRVFVDNAPSRALLKSAGFREVGTYERHGRRRGAWMDVAIFERLLGDAAKR